MLLYFILLKELFNTVTLKLDKKAITQKGYIKYLGIVLDKHLNWKKHISIISKKISRAIGIMYRLRPYISTSLLKTIYYSLIYSHLIYAIHVWGSANNTLLDSIFV